MKKLLYLVLVLGLFACSSDSKIHTFEYEIGDYYEEGGGIIYSLQGGHGRVVTMQDIGTGNWYEAEDMAENNTTGGYDDWELPSIYDLQIIYDTVGQGGGNIAGFEHSRYWSSTEASGWGNGYYAFDFGTGESFIGLYGSANARVRAVRSF